MTGFIKGLFGGKKKEAQADAPRSKDAFFLAPDDAKTFGNIDYMRKSNTIEHTFPRGKARVSQVSATSYRKIQESTFSTGSTGFSSPASPMPSSSFTPNQSSFQPSSFTPPSPSFNQGKTAVKRSANTGMDMFRKMAKDIKKR